MDIKIRKMRDYNVPKGIYRAKVVDFYAVKSKNECDQTRKLVLAPLKLETKARLQTAAKTYCVDEPSDELMEDLMAIMGEELEEHVLDNGSFDTDAMIGRHVDAVVDHLHGDSYEKPFAFVSKIYPAGTLVKEV
jgi:hypothetical protein